MGGFAAGVMVAASVWSLLIPAMEQSAALGRWAFGPAAGGFVLGMLFLLLLDSVTPHMHPDRSVEGPRKKLARTTLLVLAVTLHNIPEGMAVGVLYAGWLADGGATVPASGALALAIGIAIQNFPEGMIVSMPLRAEGLSRRKACLLGVLSGAVEPAAGLLTVLLASVIVPALPVLLGFAAGAMMYVVVEELVPEMAEGRHSNWGTLAFMAGFCVMMALDVALG